ncbi:AmmeMemoRadiSam system protein B [Candidatus Peregrinibacteria bacterium]|nr:AmmeMemoRadiSam system protein B [Candidatus Peregrinibacteria bacterium]
MKYIATEYEGIFYPSDPQVLKEYIEKCESANTDFGPDLSMLKIKALIVPSGDYVNAGAIALSAYRELAHRKIKKVIILGSSSYVRCEGICLTEKDGFECPLGNIEIEKADITKLKQSLPFNVNEQVMKKQHSIEVQLPYIKHYAPNAKVVPLVIGKNIKFAEVADKIAELVTEQTIIVVSTNFSHYLSYDKANVADKISNDAIMSMVTKDILEQGEASSINGLAILNEIALLKEWTPMFLKYSNSGEDQEDKNSVIGYSSFLYFED